MWGYKPSNKNSVKEMKIEKRMKMKIWAVLLGITILMSCQDSRYKATYSEYSEYLTWSAVKSQFPNSRVYHANGSTCMYWLVIDSTGHLWEVQTGSSASPEVTKMEKKLEIK